MSSNGSIVRGDGGSDLRTTYDYIVVGAGSAGSVLAAELSSSGAAVLVIESGGNDDAPTVLDPSIWFYNVAGPMDYHVPILPSRQLKNRNLNMALGHVLGGGSSINGLVWGRGMQRDFDGWARDGAAGWAFADVLPVFKAQEDWEGGENEWRGTGGPVHVRRPRDPHPAARAFLEAARQLGMPVIDDMNGPMQPGAGFINMNIGKDGTRVSAARAFLRPALSRPNLTLLLNTDVQKVTFRGKRATGVRIIVDGNPKDVGAEREVILTAGAIGSPKILMLSGVGDAAALRTLRIDVVEHVPGVGQNLQDQILLLGVVFKYKGKMPEHRPDSNAVEAEAYWSSGHSTEGTDINLVLHQMTAVTPEVAARFGNPPEDCFTIGPALVQPTSYGSVRLASSAHDAPVVLDPNYLGTDFDFKATMRAIELARELGHQSAFDDIRAEELIPGPSATSRDIEDLLRAATTSFGHGVGTCRIGVDGMAVVDPQLRVHGVDGLRVADSSVMPRMVTGPTNAPTFMVAGKAARLILAEARRT
jgi:choline dehydrogenase